MKKTKHAFRILSLLLASFLLAGVANAANEVSRDLSRSRFEAVWANRNTLMMNCMYTQNPCNLSQGDIRLISKMLKSSADEKELIFSSSRQNPEHFGGVYASRSLVATLSKSEAQIYVNTDALTLNGQFTTPIQAVTHLFAAWVQHQGLSWHSALVFGQKVAQYWVSRIESTAQKTSNFAYLDMVVFQGMESFFILIDQKTSHDLTLYVKNYLVCSGGNRPLAVLSAHKGAWTQFTKTTGAQAAYQAEITYVCGLSNRILETWTAKLNLYMSYEIEDGDLVLNEPSLRMRLVDVRRAN